MNKIAQEQESVEFSNSILGLEEGGESSVVGKESQVVNIVPESQTELPVKKQKNYYPHLIGMNVLLLIVAIILAVVIATSSGSGNKMLEPPLPGMIQNNERPNIILGMDINYPPYAELVDAKEGGGQELGGFGIDVARGVAEMCDWNLTIVETAWLECWNAGYAGHGLLKGNFHGCMTYTHTRGKRDRMVSFSNSILKNNKPGGLLVRLKDGKPTMTGMDDLTGKIGDVRGWAPTDDGLSYSTNSCTGKPFGKFKMNIPAEDPAETNANDQALKLLLDSTYDGVWIYADQASKYGDACEKDSLTSSCDCTLWANFGTTFAYVHTGLDDWSKNGTTLTLSRPGSGLNEIVNPCLQKFMASEGYAKVCEKYPDLRSNCYSNSDLPDVAPPTDNHFKKSKDLTSTCADGYCPCNAPLADP